MRISKIFITVLIVGILAGCSSNKVEDPLAKEFKNQTAQQIFVSGEQALSKKKYDTAIHYFEALDALYPFGDYSRQGHLDIIYAYYMNSNYDVAIASADRYIRLYPRDTNVDYAYYMKGLAYFSKSKYTFRLEPAQRDLSSMQEAFVSFEELIKFFPKSQYAPDARNRMLYIHNLLARHELQVAEFYYKRKIYVAAANRAGYIVQHLQGAPQVPEALKIMVKSYRALGATQQAEDALRVLKLNYPNEKLGK